MGVFPIGNAEARILADHLLEVSASNIGFYPGTAKTSQKVATARALQINTTYDRHFDVEGAVEELVDYDGLPYQILRIGTQFLGGVIDRDEARSSFEDIAGAVMQEFFRRGLVVGDAEEMPFLVMPGYADDSHEAALALARKEVLHDSVASYVAALAVDNPEEVATKIFDASTMDGKFGVVSIDNVLQILTRNTLRYKYQSIAYELGPRPNIETLRIGYISMFIGMAHSVKIQTPEFYYLESDALSGVLTTEEQYEVELNHYLDAIEGMEVNPEILDASSNGQLSLFPLPERLVSLDPNPENR